MFGISFGEIVIIGIVALLVLDPKDIPKLIHAGRRYWSMLKNELHHLKRDSWSIIQEYQNLENEVHSLSEIEQIAHSKSINQTSEKHEI